MIIAMSDRLPASPDDDVVLLLERLAAIRSGNADLDKAITHALQVLEQCIDTYGLERTSICFNGGKDATVLLHLVRIVLANKSRSTVPGTANGTVPTAQDLNSSALTLLRKMPMLFYRCEDDEFPEVQDFVDTVRSRYGLMYDIYDANNLISGLEDIIEKRNVKAVAMGVRNGDPNSASMGYFVESSPGWPPVMRVNPILDWDYNHVWRFLRGCGLEYCSLYDEGYTSLGRRSDTEKNPALLVTGGTGPGKYEPAYKLKDGNLERLGRKKK